MPVRNLREYLDSLPPGECLRIKDRVSRDYDITTICMALDRRKLNPVLVFENVEGSSMPVLTNIFGSRKRIMAMMGATEDDFSKKWLAAESRRIEPVVIERGAVHDTVKTGAEIDVQSLPIMRHFRTDAGRYVTAGFVIAKDPSTGLRNLSFHRLMVKGPCKMGISLHSRQHLWHYYCEAEKLGRPLEIAVVIGAHPLVVLAASAKTDIAVDELDIAGGLLGRPVELLRGRTVNVEYPADAEIVLEGTIPVDEFEDEGPFGEYTGFSTSRSTRNVFRISALCMRANPHYLSIVAGASTDHLNLMRVAKETLVWERLKERVPNVRRLHYPKSGINYHGIVSMAPGATGTVRHALMLLFGLDPYLKLIIAVDEDIDIEDEAAVMWALATRMQGVEDMFMVPKVYTNQLDPSSSEGMGTKVGVDATASPDSDSIVLKVDPEDAERSEGLLMKLLGTLTPTDL